MSERSCAACEERGTRKSEFLVRRRRLIVHRGYFVVTDSDSDETLFVSPVSFAPGSASHPQVVLSEDSDDDATCLVGFAPAESPSAEEVSAEETLYVHPRTQTITAGVVPDADETFFAVPVSAVVEPPASSPTISVSDEERSQAAPLPEASQRPVPSAVSAGISAAVPVEVVAHPHLPPGFSLHGYTIRRVIGQGGFGVTYLAYHEMLDELVVVKENMPASLANRDTYTHSVQPLTSGDGPGTYSWALNNFLNEAKTLRRLDHPNIIKVNTAFLDMGTAYYVMPFIDGASLEKAEVPMPEKRVLPLLTTLLRALQYLHGLEPMLLHRDIKPANILCRADGSPVLIDFGTARQLISEHSQTTIESAGYTPFEQIQSHGNIGPWTDLYALGATMYFLITGTKPMKSSDRMGRQDRLVPLSARAELQRHYSQRFLCSIDKAMALWPEDRWQSAAAWLEELNSLSLPAPSVSVAQTPAPTVAAESPSLPARRQNAAVPARSAAGAGGEISPASKLSFAVFQGDAAGVRAAIALGADLRANPEVLSSPVLVYAARFEHTEIEEILVKAGADPDQAAADGCTALMLAADLGQTAMAKLLIGAGASLELKDKAGLTALMYAARRGYSAIVEALLAAGAAPENPGDIVTALVYATEEEKPDIVRMLLAAGASPSSQDSYGRPALMIAMEKRCYGIVSALLEAGADPNCSGNGGRTPLMMAVKERQGDVARGLIAFGAAPDAADADGKTALMFAAELGQENMAEALLAAGAAYDMADAGGKTALMLAADGGFPGVVDVLLRVGANPDMADEEGATALIYAARHGFGVVLDTLISVGSSLFSSAWNTDKSETKQSHDDCVVLLLAGGADADCRDRKGMTALMYAAARGHIGIVHALVAHGVALQLTNNVGQTALILAQKRSTADCFLALLKANDADGPHMGVDAPLAEALDAALSVCKGREHGAQALSQADKQLLLAAYAADRAGVKAALQSGARAEAAVSGFSALMLAAAKGNADTAKLLLSAGADLARENNVSAARTYTPLQIAVRFDNTGVVEYLLVHHPARLTKSDLLAAYRLALAKGHVHLVRTFLNHGASPEMDMTPVDTVFNTPLKIAVSRRHAELVRLLVEKGADINKKDGFLGESAFTWAKTYAELPEYAAEAEPILSFLKSRGGRRGLFW